MRLPLGEALDVVDRLGANISVGVDESCVVRNAEDRERCASGLHAAITPLASAVIFFNSGITPTNGVMAAASQ
jgi:hypothetical protein